MNTTRDCTGDCNGDCTGDCQLENINMRQKTSHMQEDSFYKKIEQEWTLFANKVKENRHHKSLYFNYLKEDRQIHFKIIFKSILEKINGDKVNSLDIQTSFITKSPQNTNKTRSDLYTPNKDTKHLQDDIQFSNYSQCANEIESNRLAPKHNPLKHFFPRDFYRTEENIKPKQYLSHPLEDEIDNQETKRRRYHDTSRLLDLDEGNNAANHKQLINKTIQMIKIKPLNFNTEDELSSLNPEGFDSTRSDLSDISPKAHTEDDNMAFHSSQITQKDMVLFCYTHGIDDVNISIISPTQAETFRFQRTVCEILNLI